jgi:hypothetical protein
VRWYKRTCRELFRGPIITCDFLKLLVWGSRGSKDAPLGGVGT